MQQVNWSGSKEFMNLSENKQVRGKLIILEGIDASGKTTVSALVEKLLSERNYRTKSVSKHFEAYEDSNKYKFATGLKQLIWHDYDDSFITTHGCLYKFSLWYVILLSNYIAPMLNEYDYIIVDGWFYKIYARLSLKPDFNEKIGNEILKTLIVGDEIFLFNIDPCVAYSRRKAFTISEMGFLENDYENEKDNKESFIEYQNKVQQRLVNMQIRNTVIVDVNSLSAKETAEVIMRRILRNK